MKSAVIWTGNSRYDGSPLVAILTGMDGSSANPKTGTGESAMAQLYILRADIDPNAAMQGHTSGNCGNCKHQSTYDAVTAKWTPGSCYVQVFFGPGSAYRAWVNGSYPVLTPAEAANICRERGIPIRIGAYGDGALIDPKVLRSIVRGIGSTGWTGYTHAWREQPHAKRSLMASVDTPDEARTAWAKGWRTFRTRLASEPLLPGEIACPASAEMGYRTVCATCRLCDGTRPGDTRRNIAIIAHGSTVSKYIALRAV